MPRLTILFLLGAAAPLVGCGGGQDEPPLTPAAYPSPETVTTVEQIASARCDHAQRCNTIGANAEYATPDHCMNVMRTDARNEIAKCRYGINQANLRECLVEIGNEDCSGPSEPLDKLESLAACSRQHLCLD